MSAQLKNRGYHVGRRKARRYMNEMDICPIYPKMNLSKRMQQAKVCPYLLRNAVIDAPNQAWSIDITYIPIKHGFLYLTAIIDWYSRCIVGWEVDDTLDTRMVINALKKAFKTAKPQILNSDQGCQFTSQQYIDFVKGNGIRQSMDGKSRWADNIMIERWFRSFKYEEAYLTQYNNIKEARAAIGRYIHTYNFERCHSALDYKTPAECYYPAMLLPWVCLNEGSYTSDGLNLSDILYHRQSDRMRLRLSGPMLHRRIRPHRRFQTLPHGSSPVYSLLLFPEEALFLKIA